MAEHGAKGYLKCLALQQPARLNISTLLKPYFQVALPNNRLAETQPASKKQ
ncbi:hypothetical protein EIKCOROL_01145 [Eikenella corrodens ATCC 23834]|uniref:Uncharacterized protein n=1 Tax=Eikenella corrodens ATCC 23834 TaxID=546274 RepID=C0DUV7_EIKCO|nr:hypothetical protein EIKCOROL_01145 [Eikenella corrodens ATCC 23834]